MDVHEEQPADPVGGALQKLNPDLQAASNTPAAFSGLGMREVVADGRVLYVSEDGRYVIEGQLYDVDKRVSLSEKAMQKNRVTLLADIPAKDRIIFAPDNPKYRVVVFTDIECGFCRKFHRDIEAYNAAGIAVEYVAFPRMGIGSEDFAKMNSVWCAKDPKAALSQAKLGGEITEGKPNCISPVAAQYAAGRSGGLTGTPMILATDGTQLGGYLTPPELLNALKMHAAQRQTAAS